MRSRNVDVRIEYRDPAGSLGSLRGLVRSKKPADGLAGDVSIRRFWLAALAASLVSSLSVVAVSALLHSRHTTSSVVSGRASPRKTRSGHVERWGRGHVEVALDPSLASVGPGARDAVELAFGAWVGSGATLPSLSFRVLDQPADGDDADGINSVRLAPITAPGHTNDLAITIARSNDDTGEIEEADIIVNSRHKFELFAATDGAQGAVQEDDEPSCDHPRQASCDGAYDLQDVVTHEVGHFFGLAEDSRDRLATMFECSSSCETHKRDLNSDDLTSIDSLYAGASYPSDTTQASVGCDVSPAQNAPPRLAWWWLVGLVSASRLSRAASRRK